MATKMVYVCSCGTTFNMDAWLPAETHLNDNPTHTVTEGHAHTSGTGVPRQVPVEAPDGTIYRVSVGTSGGVSSASDAGQATKMAKSKLNASTDPGVDDDGTEGYEIGSRWLNTTSGDEFVCFGILTGAAVWGSTTQSSGGVGIWGSDAAFAESQKVSITTSTKYYDKVVLEVTATEAGTYRVGWNYKWNADTTSYDFLAQLLHNSTQLWEHVQEPKDSNGDFEKTGSNQRYQAAGFLYLDLTAGPHTLYLQWATGSNGNEASIWNAALEFWRHS